MGTDMNVMSFSDGVLLLDELRFVPSSASITSYMPRKHFNVTCPIRSRKSYASRASEVGAKTTKRELLSELSETPYWDQALRCQMYDDEEQRRWLNAHLGLALENYSPTKSEHDGNAISSSASVSRRMTVLGMRRFVPLEMVDRLMGHKLSKEELPDIACKWLVEHSDILI
jgi:hypothetical protein